VVRTMRTGVKESDIGGFQTGYSIKRIL